MSRICLFNDLVAHYAWKYMHNELSASQRKKLYKAIFDYTYSKFMTLVFIEEIAYQIGYAKSRLFTAMSETTYKKRKRIIRNKIDRILQEGG